MKHRPNLTLTGSVHSPPRQEQQAPDRSVQIPWELAVRLEQFRLHVRNVALAEGLGLTGLVLAAGMAIALFADAWYDVSWLARTALLCGVLLLTAYVAFQSVWRRSRQRSSLAELAGLVDRAHPELKERLSSTVELHEAEGPESWKGSPLMRQLLLNETLAQVADLNFSEAVSAGRAGRLMTTAAVAWVLLLSPFFISSAAYGLLVGRMIAPWANLARATNLYFEVSPGDTVVARGSGVVIRAQPRWHKSREDLADPVELHWFRKPASEAPSAAAPTQRRMIADEQGAFVVTLPHLMDNFEYEVRAGLAATQRFRVIVADPPAIASARLEIQPPAYTGNSPQVVDNPLGAIRVLEGSRLQFQLRFTKPVVQAELVWLDRPEADARMPLALASDRLSATLSLRAERSDRYEFAIQDDLPLTNQPEPERSLAVVPDLPPVLVLADDPRPQARPDDVLIINATASDDIGVAALELHFSGRDGQEQQLTCPAVQVGSTAVAHEFRLNLANLQPQAGDIIRWRVRAADGRPDPGPQEVWSDERVVVIDAAADPSGSSELQARHADLLAQMEAIRGTLQRSSQELAELYKAIDAAGRKQEAFQEPERIAAAEREQAQLAERVEHLANSLAEHPLLGDLSDEARGLIENELRAAAAHLETAQGRRDLARKRDDVQKSREQLQAGARRLDDVQRKFEKIARLERQLLALARLAEQSRDLADQLQRLAPQGNDMAENPDGGEPGAHAERTQQDRANAARSQSGNLSQSAKPGKNSGSAAPRTTTASQADDERRQRETQKLQERGQDLATTLENLLRESPDLLDAARRLELNRVAELTKELRQLAATEQALSQGLQQTAQEMAEQLKPVAERQLALLEQMQQLDRTLGALDEKTDTATSPTSKPQSDQAAEKSATPPTPPAPTAEGKPAAEQTPSQSETDAPKPNPSNPDATSAAASKTAAPGEPAQVPATDNSSASLSVAAAMQSAVQELQQGNFEAAKRAQQLAAVSLEQRLKELQSDAAASKDAQQAAQGILDSQRKLQQEMNQVAAKAGDRPTPPDTSAGVAPASPSKQPATPAEAQRTASEQTGKISRNLQDAAKALGDSPLDLALTSEQILTAAQPLTRAQQTMQQSGRQSEQSNAAAAAQSAQAAAEYLEEAARITAAALDGSGGLQISTPIVPEVAANLMQALDQMRGASSSSSSAMDPARAGPSNRPSRTASKEPSRRPGDGSAQRGNAGTATAATGATESEGSKSQPGADGSAGQAARQASRAMQRAAELLAAAARMTQPASIGSPGESPQNGASQSFGGASSLRAAGGSNDHSGAASLARRQSKIRRWGELPGHLQTEILNGSGRKPNRDYAELIERYFKEIARIPATTAEPNKAAAPTSTDR